MTITIEAIKAQHAKVAELLSRWEAQQQTQSLKLEAVTIQLAAGEQYAGMVLNEQGIPSHHLILLPGSAEELSWSDAGTWAAEQGGALPTRSEQSLLFANLKSHFGAGYHWSSEEHESESGFAWYQGFNDGYQDGGRKGAELRARAVRRLPIR